MKQTIQVLISALAQKRSMRARHVYFKRNYLRRLREALQGR